VESTDDLGTMAWVVVARVRATSGSIGWSDSRPVSEQARFYRLIEEVDAGNGD
jgi:hypothetical protein